MKENAMPEILPDDHVIQTSRRTRYDWEMIFDGTGRAWKIGEEVPETFKGAATTKVNEMVKGDHFVMVTKGNKSFRRTLVGAEIGTNEDKTAVEVRGIWEESEVK
jgi:hypothetical protein